MNYYPGYYPQYGNNNQYLMPQMTQPQYFQQQQLQNMQNQMQVQQAQGLNGKIVDSADVVRATEVPIGSYGIFPKADLQEIYIKRWNNDGTTSIITFKPSTPEASVNTVSQEAVMQSNSTAKEILEKVNLLEDKLNEILAAATTPTPRTNTNVKR